MGESKEKDAKPAKSNKNAAMMNAVHKITKEMANRPVVVCSCMTAFIILLVIVLVASGLATLTEPSAYDWTIASTEESRNEDALAAAQADADKLSDLTGSRTQPYDDAFQFVYIAKKKEDLYTPENLQQMCLTESTLVLDKDFPKFCQLVSEGSDECVMAWGSVVVYFYDFNTLSDWNCSLLSTAAVATKRDVLYSAMTTPEGVTLYGSWLDKNAVDRGFTIKSSSRWNLGAPLEGFDSKTSKEEDQDNKYTGFVTKKGGVGGVEETLFDFFDIDSNADGMFPYYPSPYMQIADAQGVEVMWQMGLLNNNETTRTVNSDLMFAIFSILFVWIWMRVHTGSTFTASMGMYMVFCSIPVSMLIYKGLFQIPYFDSLHTLVIFIVLGVGADDIFVLVDSWKQTREEFPGDISFHRDIDTTHKRLESCYAHTLVTVFNTSFTTSMAFIATGLSPLMPIATFGWFAATCIVMNYIFVITLMPPVVIIAEMYFEPLTWKLLWGKLTGNSAETTSNEPKKVETSEPKDFKEEGKDGEGEEASGLEMVSHSVPQNEATLGDANGAGGEPGAVAVQLDDHSTTFGWKPVHAYMDFIEWGVPLSPDKKLPITAIVLVVGLFAFAIVGIIYGLALTPPTEAEQWFPTQHMVTQINDVLAEDFLGADGDSYENVYFTFGIKGLDRDGFDKYKPGKNRGEPVYDKKYELAAPACQQAFIRMCEDIRDYSCDADACKPTKQLARLNSTECFMIDFREWSDTTYSEDTFQMNETHFYSRLLEYRQSGYQRYSPTNTWQSEIGFINDEFKYGTMYFTSTMKSVSSMTEKQDVADRVHDFSKRVKRYEECEECNCNSLIYTSEGAFTWMKSENGLVSGFYQGLSIAFPVALIVLLAATRNIIISVYAIATVFFIVFGVLGFTNYGLGWDLGIAESIAGIIIIGFSVDYTVHLGHMYNEGEHEGLHTRKEKFRFASEKIVMTIVGGAITTAGAGVFMFACQLTFFYKMAALIVCTILLSYIYSLGFFMSLLYLAGPEKDEGNVVVYYQKLKGYFTQKSENGMCAVNSKPTAPSVSDDSQLSGMEADEVVPSASTERNV